MRFSIVTPSFRQLDWLRLCVASVKDQAGVEVEHIVQDAGSRGIEELQSSAHLRVISEQDDGMYDAINRGLARARGDICAWLNSDEQYLPGALARVARAFAEAPEVEMIFGDLILVDARGEALGYRRTILPERTHLRLNHLNTASCATFFRRSLVERGLLFDPAWKSIGDAVWMESLLRAGMRMRVLGEPLAVFTMTGENLSTEGRSHAELERWRTAPDAPPQWLKIPSSLLHRVRKWVAGAYRRRDMDYAIHTLASPDRRVDFHARRIGHSWPASKR